MKRMLFETVICLLVLVVPLTAQEIESKKKETDTTQYALQFNGRDAYISVSNIPFDTFDTFTVEAWVKQWKHRLVYQGMEGDPENSLWLSLGSRGFTCGWESDQGRNYSYIIREESRDAWDHVAMVYDGTQQKMFLNGKRVYQTKAPGPGPLDNTRPFLIGAQQNWDPSQKKAAVRNGRGLLGALRISSVARYSKPFTPKRTWKADDETAVLYNLAEQNTEKLFDASKNKRHGTLHNTKWISLKSDPNVPQPAGASK